DRMLTEVSQGGVDVAAGRGWVDRRDTRMAIEASLLPPLFDARGVAIVATDVSDRVTAMSPPAEDLLGFTEAELTGAPLHERLRSRGADGSPVSADDCH